MFELDDFFFLVYRCHYLTPQARAPSTPKAETKQKAKKTMMNCSRPAKVPVPWSGTRKDAFVDNNLSTFDVDTINTEFSLKMSQISLEERSSGLNDLHGVADPIIETMEMVQSKTNEMTTALNDIASRETQESLAFRKALAKSPKYVDSQKVRLLRAVDYDSEAAAEKMVRFFDQKMEYFGENKLVKDIEFEDLGKEETDALQRGIYQLLPERDRAGRFIVLHWGRISTEYSTEAMFRVALYFVDSALRDEEIQKHGIVFVYYANGQTHRIKGRLSAGCRLWLGLPIRLGGYHACEDTKSTIFGSAKNIIAKMMEIRFLCRYRIHTGSHMECIYYLMTFGIQRETIPIREDGTIDLTNHHRVLETLKYREKHQQAFDFTHHSEEESTSSLSISSSSMNCEQSPPLNGFILVPGPMDILLGKGRRQENRPGMLRLMNLLDEYWDEYEAASRFRKNVISRIIFDRLKESKCRFLNEVPGGYEECDDAIALDRIARKFRVRRAKEKRGSSGDNIQTVNNKDKKEDASFGEVSKRHSSELTEW